MTLAVNNALELLRIPEIQIMEMGGSFVRFWLRWSVLEQIRLKSIIMQKAHPGGHWFRPAFWPHYPEGNGSPPPQM